MRQIVESTQTTTNIEVLVKHITSLIALLIISISFGCQTHTETDSESSSTPSMGSENDGMAKLYIEYRENDPRINATRYNSINNELDRYHYLKRNFEKVAEKMLPEYELEFSRFPLNAPEGADVLEIIFLRIEAPNRIELELSLRTSLDRGEEENDFGVSLTRTVPLRPATSSSIDRDLDIIYSKASEEIIADVLSVLRN